MVDVDDAFAIRLLLLLLREAHTQNTSAETYRKLPRAGRGGHGACRSGREERIITCGIIPFKRFEKVQGCLAR